MQNKEGQFRAYVCVEYNIEEGLKAIDAAMKADKELRMEYNYEKFKETFNKEMNSLNQQQ
ncbi:MAG: hypothetical protein SNH01_05660 [Rikenellaceae bacterium]